MPIISRANKIFCRQIWKFPNLCPTIFLLNGSFSVFSLSLIWHFVILTKRDKSWGFQHKKNRQYVFFYCFSRSLTWVSDITERMANDQRTYFYTGTVQVYYHDAYLGKHQTERFGQSMITLSLNELKFLELRAQLNSIFELEPWLCY